MDLKPYRFLLPLLSLLLATAMGFGSALTSGKALKSPVLRSCFGLAPSEFAPCFISMGTVTARNEALVKSPELVNTDPYGGGWLIRVTLADAAEITNKIDYYESRIAASSVAKRIADELKSPLGEVVGYKVRFQDRLQVGASVKLMTDGILLAETQSDPLLKAYDTLIIDEAHERSLNIDFLLGYLRQILPRRPDLKIVVTSATIDADRFAQHFASAKGPAPVILVSGRTFPVEQRWKAFEETKEFDLNDAIADAVDELWRSGSDRKSVV